MKHIRLQSTVEYTSLTKAAVAEVLTEADVAQLAGCDLAHLQSHGRALARHLHAHTHRLHLQHQHGHLDGMRTSWLAWWNHRNINLIPVDQRY